LAHRHKEITAAGARVVGISVDDPGRNAAMVEKLHLPFPLLADPGGGGAIKPYGLWNPEEKGGIAYPAVLIVGPDGEERHRVDSRDFADRPTEDEILEHLAALDLGPVTQEPPAPGDPQPSDRAVKVRALVPYLLGAKSTAKAIGLRVPEAQEQGARHTAMMATWIEAVRALPRD
jgi:alkyl hydroperoxide reductase subunit AhpC